MTPLHVQDAIVKEKQVGQLKATVGTVEREIKVLESAPRTADAEGAHTELVAASERMKGELAAIKEAGELMSAADRAKIEKTYDKVVGEWRKRKRMMSDLVGTILENYPKSKKALIEDMGAETDEDAKIDIKAL